MHNFHAICKVDGRKEEIHFSPRSKTGCMTIDVYHKMQENSVKVFSITCKPLEGGRLKTQIKSTFQITEITL